MIFMGVDIDLLYCRVERSSIPAGLTLEDDAILKNMDEKSVRSINGCRVADSMLRLIPDRAVFKEVLRTIKVWAKRRGVYSNVLGFFGGITWALLVARVCQLYPHAATATVAQSFFAVFGRWAWPKPVILCSITEEKNEPGLMGFKVWNPKANKSDRDHLMPILTPAFPSMNSTHNVSESTKALLVEEIQRGERITAELDSSAVGWDTLFE